MSSVQCLSKAYQLKQLFTHLSFRWTVPLIKVRYLVHDNQTVLTIFLVVFYNRPKSRMGLENRETGCGEVRDDAFLELWKIFNSMILF
jgi:hypothetical protein